MFDFLFAVTLNFSNVVGSHIWKVLPCPTNNMLFLIFACFNNFDVSEILPSLSNCKLILSDKIDVAKKSLFSSKGLSESIVFEIFSILSWGHASIDWLLNDG